MFGKNILLLEPGYKNKYPPLGLMKLAAYHRNRGDKLRFAKGEDVSVLREAWDRVYVTTLFSFEWDRTSRAIDFAIRAAGNQPERVFVGGIAASLMHNEFVKEPKWAGVRFIAGLLDRAPARALRLSVDEGDFGADDITGTPIEEHVPDYDILEDIDYTYPVNDAYFGYASRGCIRKCHFCGVPKLEGMQKEMPPLSNLVEGVDAKYGPKKDLILMDNNITASSRYKEIIAEIRDLGFMSGAKLQRKGRRVPVQRRVDFNQGVDARILCKAPVYLQTLATVCIKPLRIAFDHLGLKKPYEQAVRYAAEYGLTELSNYMLYNFHDDPADLFERMRLNVKLNEELGVRVWSFPMRYQPTDRPDRGHVGEKWSRYQLRSMQIILQATHGVVSGKPDFFKRAFGDTFEDFARILLLPHDFIFNRDWFERFDPEERLAVYREEFAKLSGYERAELIELLSSCNPREFTGLSNQATTTALKRVLQFYVPLSREELFEIWEKQKEIKQDEAIADMGLAEDERVEDAGLDHKDEVDPSSTQNPAYCEGVAV